MQYLLLITGEQPSEHRSQAEMDPIMGEYWAFDKAVADAGVKVGGEALQGVETATTVRVRGDERIITPGPFAETREVIGGFYLLDVPDLDAALDWAARCPGAKYGSIEVRPIMVFDNP